MPSADLLLFFQKDLKLEKQWWVNGQHYAKTCEVCPFFISNLNPHADKSCRIGYQRW